MNLGELGEFGLIETLRALLRERAGVRLGIGDDAAILEPLRHPIVTCDALVEGVHFRRDWGSPRGLGCKAMVVNVSDIAAMGGWPVAAVITLAVSPRDDLAYLEELYRGMEEAAADYGLTIVGGDTVAAPHDLTIGITVIGEAPRPVRRDGARLGDALLVTGSLGDSKAGLELLRATGFRVTDKSVCLTTDKSVCPTGVTDEARQWVLGRHLEPTARLAAMRAAMGVSDDAGHPAVRAALDISDGLAGDASHIAQRSGLGLELEVARLPISPACHAVAAVLGGCAQDWALGGGEDYELLICVAPRTVEAVRGAIFNETGLETTEIGRCVEGGGVTVILADGRRAAAAGGYRHF